jgi:hypothetical protein
MIHPFFSLSGAIPQALDAIQQVADAVATAGGRLTRIASETSF